MWAVVPVKDLAGAKEPLAPMLHADERRELFRAMLGDVLRDQTLQADHGVRLD